SRGMDESALALKVDGEMAFASKNGAGGGGGGMGGGGFGGGLNAGKGFGSRGREADSRRFLGRTAPEDADDEAGMVKSNGAKKESQNFMLGQQVTEIEKQSRKKAKDKREGKRQIEEQTMDKLWFKQSEALGIARDKMSRLYTRVAPTMEWMENNYYRLLPESQNSELVTSNRFWRDYASHREGAFLS
ncbi:MAG: hypothetical protein GY818_22500, partial [Planctomycetaceae bacterium]|nr:hypothetical protein [Planctomycetaceae bacterium]